MPTQRLLTVAGLSTPLLEAGPAEASEALWFIHGNPGSRLDWADLVERVGLFARAVAFDNPGFGEADKPTDFDYSVPGYARFLEAARQELGIRRAHLVLHDFGGPFGLEWAGGRLGEVASVTILNAPPVQDYRWYLLAHAWQTPVLGELVQATLFKPIFRATVRRGHPKGLPEDFIDRMFRDYDGRTKRAVLALYRATDARRMVATDAAVFARAGIPALVAWAGRDVYMAPRYAYVHRQAFPSARIVELPDLGHFLLAEDPERVAEVVVPWLRERVGA